MAMQPYISSDAASTARKRMVQHLDDLAAALAAVIADDRETCITILDRLIKEHGDRIKGVDVMMNKMNLGDNT